jgi:5-methylcytosine-specific restriction endonuclease McrA
MTPEQKQQLKDYLAFIPSIPTKWARNRHRKKAKLFKQQDGLCCLCHKPMTIRLGTSKGRPSKSDATFEHKHLKSEGGTNACSNVPLSHSRCNHHRGVEDFETFKTRIAEHGGKLPPPAPGNHDLKRRMAVKGDAEAMEAIIAKKT